jgi:molybdate transport system ATP-binding protein
VIDVDIRLTVTDRARRFELAARFATDAPFAALYGPSGSGKTLTLQAIAGLLAPSAGHVRLDGRTLFDAAAGIALAPAQRRVGYLFQDYALFPHLTVRENVAFGLTSWHQRRPSPADARRVDDLLGGFGLGALADSRPATLSGGQKQRVALARALASEPQVLLLDEPFASLNPMLRESLRQELGQVRRRWGIPALMITHDIEDVLALADVAFVYEEGQVIREVNLRDGAARERARLDLTGVPAREDTPLRQRLRGLLTGPGR